MYGHVGCSPLTPGLSVGSFLTCMDMLGVVLTPGLSVGSFLTCMDMLGVVL